MINFDLNRINKKGMKLFKINKGPTNDRYEYEILIFTNDEQSQLDTNVYNYESWVSKTKPVGLLIKNDLI